MGTIKDQTEHVLPESAERETNKTSNRRNRKKNAKYRWDKMDGFINELNDLVPGCPQLSEKLDKVIVLKKTVDFLKNQKDVASSNKSHTVMSSHETCFVILAKIIKLKQHNVGNWLDVDMEFTSRQNMDGTFLYLDPRCIPITGYLPYEILGSMIFELIHADDQEMFKTSFEALLENGESDTEDYRILTKGCQWILIKTKSFISYNHWNSKPEFICSTHTLIRHESVRWSKPVVNADNSDDD